MLIQQNIYCIFLWHVGYRNIFARAALHLILDVNLLWNHSVIRQQFFILCFSVREANPPDLCYMLPTIMEDIDQHKDDAKFVESALVLMLQVIKQGER